MSSGARVTVEAPLPVEPARSLLTFLNALRGRIVDGTINAAPEYVATTPEGGEDQAPPPAMPTPEWSQGVQFVPDGCPTTGANYDPLCADDDADGPSTDTDGPGAVDPEDPNPVGLFDPLHARIGVDCSTLGDLNGDRARARALRVFQLEQHRLIAGEFWTGTQVEGASLPNDYLARDGHIEELAGGGPLPVLDAFAVLDARLAAGSERGVIHASPTVVALWTYLNLLRFDGAFVLSPNDNYVVSSPGYDGTAPDGTDGDGTGTHWAYATGIPNLRLATPRVTVDTDPDTNARRVFVDRLWLATFADRCVHAGTSIDLTDRA